MLKKMGILGIVLEGILTGLAGSMGIFAGLAIARLILSSHEIVNVSADYATPLGFVFILLIIVEWLFRFIFKSSIVGSIRKVLKILLLDLFLVMVVIVYVLFFNLLNMYYYRNGLLGFCCSLGRLSDAYLVALGRVSMIVMIIFNLAILFKATCSSSKIYNISLKSGVYLIGLLLLVGTVVYSFMYLTIDYRYMQVVEEFKRYVKGCDVSNSSLERLWKLVLQYEREFVATYRMPCPKPRQLLVRQPPLIDNRDFVAKLAAVSRTGACIDFALGITKIIEDVYGYKTRVVSMVGVDHVIPEVEINGTWYVIDVTYTTPKYPVKVSEYAEYLRQYYPNVYNELSGLVDFDTGEDLSSEHGFHKGGS